MPNKLSDSEVHLIAQALDLLLASKQDAFRKVAECGHPFTPENRALTPQDFGIPQIFCLMGKIDGLMVLDELESGVST